MAKKRLSGLDELMIVNPGLPGQEIGTRLGELFLGDDGKLYRLEGLPEESTHQLADFYLGEDGALYRVERLQPFRGAGLSEINASDSLCSYFLGQDGTLYQVIKS